MTAQLAMVFPGQGTQRVGMGSMFRSMSDAAAQVYADASDVVGLDMIELCSRTTPEILQQTQNAQIAIYTTSAAAFSIATELVGQPDFVAGHSVGEWAAYYAAGAVDFATGLRAVRARGQIMSAATQPGGMIAVVGMSREVIAQVCAEADPSGSVSVAAVNAPDNIVVAGPTAQLGQVLEALERRNPIRLARLRTSHAFHSSLMTPSVAAWADYVAAINLAAPRCPVALNLTGTLSTDPLALRSASVGQLDHAVLWSDCVASIANAGAETFVEVGDSKSLSAFVRATAEVKSVAMGTPGGVRQLKRQKKDA